MIAMTTLRNEWSVLVLGGMTVLQSGQVTLDRSSVKATASSSPQRAMNAPSVDRWITLLVYDDSTELVKEPP